MRRRLTEEEKETRRLEINARKRRLYLENREKHILRGKEYRRSNIEKERARYKRYDTENKEKRKQYRKDNYVSTPRRLVPKEEQKLKAKIKRDIHYKNNKNVILERNAAYRKNNPGKINNRNNKRRAAELNATPKWLTQFDLDYIKHLYIQAKELEKLDGKKYHVDHQIPLQGKTVCGLHVPWNLQILEANENMSKQNKLVIDGII